MKNNNMPQKESHVLPNKAKVTFYPETHTYVVGDKILPSITTLLKNKYGDSYSAVNPELLKKSAEYGTKVHEELSELIEARLKNPNFPIISGYTEVNHFFELVEEIYSIEPVMTEKVVLLYNSVGEPIAAGRFDLLCKVQGQLTLSDFKTTSSIHRQLVTAQLNLYLKAAKQSGYIKNDEQVRLSVIQLSGETARMVPIPVLSDNFYLKFFN